MKIALFSLAILLLLGILPRSEQQQSAWNRFWAIRPQSAQEENQSRYRETRRQYTTTQLPLVDNTFNPSTSNPALYKLEKKPFGGPFGETQFEYMLRRR